MKAAQNGHSSVVKLLLAAKAPVNYAPFNNGSTALFQATDNEQTECVRVLLNNGADANITYDHKVHCLCHVTSSNKEPYNSTCNTPFLHTISKSLLLSSFCPRLT